MPRRWRTGSGEGAFLKNRADVDLELKLLKDASSIIGKIPLVNGQ